MVVATSSKIGNMKLYRFSPIQNKEQLMEAIKHVHLACHALCMQSIDKYLPVAGNLGIFCHYDSEAEGGVPETTYTYLYIRKPDPYRYQVGDLDFYMDPDEYADLKQLLLKSEGVKGARVYYKPEKDMVELYDPDIDALGYVSNYKMAS